MAGNSKQLGPLQIVEAILSHFSKWRRHHGSGIHGLLISSRAVMHGIPTALILSLNTNLP